MPDLNTLARWVVLLGLGIAAAGVLLWLIGRSGLPLGRLPGDLRFEWGGATCFVPLASSIVLSILLTLLINLILRALNK
jgi:hypothetical protein